MTHRFARQVNTGRVVSAANIGKLEGPFQCLSSFCKEDVILKKGDIVAAHFAHKPGKSCDMSFGSGGGGGGGGGGNGESGKGESNEHAFAKHWLYEHFHTVVFKKRCPVCHRGLPTTARRHYSETYTAAMEVPINGGEFVADVALTEKKTGRIAVVLEVYHTHALTQQKYDALRKLHLDVHEVKSTDVIAVAETAAAVSTLIETIEVSGIECIDCVPKLAAAPAKTSYCVGCSNRKVLSSNMRMVVGGRRLCLGCCRQCTVCSKIFANGQISGNVCTSCRNNNKLKQSAAAAAAASGIKRYLKPIAKTANVSNSTTTTTTKTKTQLATTTK